MHNKVVLSPSAGTGILLAPDVSPKRRRYAHEELRGNKGPRTRF